ncbi:FeoB-associated Cys-rich membrane protein [Flavobacteriaceae bacterium]|nr:FeoB-associated Cys-rich membrane protein [Flavobacteriaceae bacterium]MDB2633173.1 FeoB-associated Cys-rich membrane protein [Flavobacteriaceae bacterium]MDB2684774.1 FeoB-associated Cys-rich membrane protein [Flavobacteriaceae bacterium]MDC3345095.1 FeoB-associated Cys-rich membrane protein [Flavobacteriaceae bacterium]
MQEIIVYSAVGVAVFFLVRKVFMKKTSSGCNKDCNC